MIEAKRNALKRLRRKKERKEKAAAKTTKNFVRTKGRGRGASGTSLLRFVRAGTTP